MSLRAVGITVALSLAAAAAFSADRGEAKATVAGKAVSIDYGRPSLQGRDMLGQAKVGTPWRMGADSPTRLKTAAELTFAPGVVVPPGEYVLTATKTAPDKWQIDVKIPDTVAPGATVPVFVQMRSIVSTQAGQITTIAVKQ